MSIFKSNKKQPGIFFYFVFSFLFIAGLFFIALPKIANAQSTSTAPFYDNFDDYTIGDINNQGFWYGFYANSGFVSSDSGYWLSDFKAFHKNTANLIIASSTIGLNSGSLMFFLNVKSIPDTTGTTDTYFALIQGNQPYELSFIFYLWLKKIDSTHYCVSNSILADACDYEPKLETNSFNLIGFTWNKDRQKIRYYNNSNWSAELSGSGWTDDVVGFSINQEQNWRWDFYIDNIGDNNLFPVLLTESSTPAVLKTLAYEGCEDWGLASLICKAIVYLFIPDSPYVEKFGDLFDILKSKPPFGYYYSTKDAISLLNASSTPAFSFPDMGSIKTDFFDKIRTGLAWILWIMFGFFVIKRIGDFVP